MENKQIICVFQDCPLCGDRGKKLKELIFEKQLHVRKVSFASPEGSELVAKAVYEHHIGKMPFFTDGKKFSTDLEDFIYKPKKKRTYKKKGA